MVAPKKEIVPSTPIEVAMIDPLDEFTQAISRVEDEVAEQFPDELFRILKKIAHEIGVIGLSEAESCMISDYPHEKFVELKNRYPIVAKLVEVKDLEYKRNLLKGISTKAGTDDKVAMWLLESKYPDEFNRRKGNSGGGGEKGDDMVAMAIDYVRKSGDGRGLVTEESGRAFIVKDDSGKTINLQSLKDVLK